MVTTTPKLGLPRPEGHDNVTRENHVALIDAIDENAASQSEMDTVRDIAEQAQQTADDAATAAANAQSDIDDYKNELTSLGIGFDINPPRVADDLNNEISVGWVRFETGETLNRPSDEIPDFPHSGVVRVDRRHVNRLVQTAYGVAGGTDVRIAVRTLGSAGWGDWVEVLHTGNTTDIVNQEYEVGLWTPEYITTGNPFANISITGGSSGIYTRIGRLVFIRFNLSTGYLEKGNASGELRIAGLPFPYGEPIATRHMGLSVAGAAGFEISPIENYYQWRMAVVPNSTEIVIFQNNPNTAFATAGPEILRDHTSGSFNVIRASGVYYTSSS